MAKRTKTMDGNEAAAYISYPFTEVAAIYPITPSSPMAELVDEWSAHGRTNLFGQTVKVVEMQSEAGAAGTVHGSLQGGALTTTYTASQGLLLMIPNMYKMVGELLPAVFHVSARAIATHALSIFGDHQDVMACRQTGFGMMASSNVQETMDLGCVSHLSAIAGSVPFLHFFDGFRTSHEYQKIEAIDYQDIPLLVDFAHIQEFRDRALNPEHPVIRGTAQNPDIYFQGREVANPFFARLPSVVADSMQRLGALTGRYYKLFDYYGAPDAEYVIVAMGSVCDTISETVDYLLKQGRKVGVVKVRLYRPFSAADFLEVLPSTTAKIAVLDRTKEPGSLGEPLYLDVVQLFSNQAVRPLVVGGRYGLGSKDTRPSQIVAVFENLEAAEPKNGFTIGIVDDVTHISLPETGIVDTTPEGTISCKFWGLGSDGTVGANKTAVKIIGDHTDLFAQAYFSYDSKKSGGTTISHLRFGQHPIRAPYLVYQADYIACHNPAFVYHYDLLKGMKEGGVFVLNCAWDAQELENRLPAPLKRYIAEHRLKVYTIDAIGIAQEIGLGGRINMIMQAAFFKLVNVIPLDQAVKLLKDAVAESYGAKGQKIVTMNWEAVDRGISDLVRVQVPEVWAEAADDEQATQEEPDFVKTIQRPIAAQEGDELPVSAFVTMEDGTFPLGTTAYEKRGIAVLIPEWQIEHCIQCNQCSYICPHAVVRPFLLDDEEVQRAPTTFESKKPMGKGLEGLRYRIQISPLDCTGCSNCADICPAPDKALIMRPAPGQIRDQAENWEYAMTVTDKSDRIDTTSLKGSQFVRPLFEFNGACPGCGETPYVKLLTQLFGSRMLIANATGCSSIYSASAPSFPFTTNAEGHGPAWANSLFEDNAEYGYGMFLASRQIRERLANLMETAVKKNIDDGLRTAFQEWIAVLNDGDRSQEASRAVIGQLKKADRSDPIMAELWERRHFLVKRSQWMVGGDGWAYDIGFGGLDHVVAMGDDVNLLVMDTEVYSNTGGQASKASPTSAVAKFAAAGKKIRKKDLGLMALTYGYVYVAQIAMGANMNHTIRTLIEAESYPGPSLIIAYSPCISHGIRTGMGTSIAQAKRAVQSGYWHLYRYNPLWKEKGENPFRLDSPEPKESFQEFIASEIRFSSLRTVFPEIAEEMFHNAELHAKERYQMYKRMAENWL